MGEDLIYRCFREVRQVNGMAPLPREIDLSLADTVTEGELRLVDVKPLSCVTTQSVDMSYYCVHSGRQRMMFDSYIRDIA